MSSILSRCITIVAILLISTSCMLGGNGAAMSVTPTTFDFGSVNIGVASSQTVTISNVGSRWFQVQGASISGSTAFSVGGWPGQTSLAPGSSLQLTVIFSPGDATVYNATLSVNGTRGVGTQSVSISGTGIGSTTTPTPTPVSVVLSPT